MKTTLTITLLALLVGAAVPARAEKPVATLGSYLGADIYSAEGETFTLVSTNPSNGFLFMPEPGLRLGVYFPDQRLELAALVGATVVASSYDAITSVGTTLEAQYYFGGLDSDVSPYIGLHGGGSMLGYEGDTGSTTNFGAQVGIRRMVSQGHGAIRLEARAGILNGEYESLTHVGVRIGYDLWLR